MKQTATIREIVHQLECIGIEEQSEESIQLIEDTWNSVPQEMRKEMDPFLHVVMEIGLQRSKTIYCFDMENDDGEYMYSIFMDGILRINHGEFTISEINEDTSEVDQEKGTGKHRFSFRYNGHPYAFEAEEDYDWFDTDAISYLNEVMKNENNLKRLLTMKHTCQDCIIFYNTMEWANEFQKQFGHELEAR